MDHLISLFAFSSVDTVGPSAVIKFPLLKFVPKSSLYRLQQ